MSRTSRPLLASLLVIALRAPAAAEPPCTAVAQVSGDPSLQAPLVALLRERGVPVEGESRCGVVAASVEAEGQRVRVTLVDPDQRTSVRLVADLDGAASFVESWTRGDVAAPLLVARASPPPPQQAPDREAPPAAQVFRQAPPPPRPAYAVSAFVEAGLSSDGALWRGVRGHGCLTLGRLCLGALAGYAEDLRDGGDSQALETARWALDLLVTADLPLQTGRFLLSPGVGAGLTTFKAEREVPRGDAEDVTAGLLLRGHVAGEVRFGDAWWVRLDAALGYAPLADPRLGDPADPLAGEPKTHGSVGLGLTYRAP